MKKYLLACLLCATSMIFSMNETAVRNRISQMEARLAEAQSSNNLRLQARVLYRLGRMHMRLREFTQARSYFNQLIALDNVDPREKRRAESMITHLDKNNKSTVVAAA